MCKNLFNDSKVITCNKPFRFMQLQGSNQATYGICTFHIIFTGLHIHLLKVTFPKTAQTQHRHQK